MGPQVILSDFVLPSRINQRWTHSGLDSLQHCLDKEWFLKYPYSIEYCYNSRGFRDNEWPQTQTELQQAVWCLGDSFTVGIGSPWEHTWPYLLEQKLKQRTINVSMDGASNEWIARRAVNIFQQIKPQHMVIHWTYFHRREHPDHTLSDESRRLDHVRNAVDLLPQLDNFKHCVDQVEQHRGQCQVIHSVIPNSYPGPAISCVEDSWNRLAGPDWPAKLPKYLTDVPEFVVNEIKAVYQNWNFFQEHYYTQDFLFQLMSGLDSIGWIEQIDVARDGLHYDLKTSQNVVSSICQQWSNRIV